MPPASASGADHIVPTNRKASANCGWRDGRGSVAVARFSYTAGAMPSRTFSRKSVSTQPSPAASDSGAIPACVSVWLSVSHSDHSRGGCTQTCANTDGRYQTADLCAVLNGTPYVVL